MAVRKNVYEKQAKFSVALAIIGGVCTLAGVGLVLQRFDFQDFQVVYNPHTPRLMAIGGALVGTLIPQVGATFLPLRGVGLLDNLVIAVIVIAGLCYFFFALKPDRPAGRVIRGIGRFGRLSLMVALGSFLGSRVLSLLSAVVERFQFLGQWLRTIWP